MSADTAQIEQRLAKVEATLIQVQQQLGLAPSRANWVEQVSGSLSDIAEEDYQQFLDCCRAVRRGDRVFEPEEPRP